MRDLARNRHVDGSLHDIVFALEIIPEAVGARYLSLSGNEWEPALSEGDLYRLLGGEEGPGIEWPEHTRSNREDRHELS